MINLKRILKVVDFGLTDESNLAGCVTLARKFDAQLHLLHVVAEHGLPRFGSRERLRQAEAKQETFGKTLEGIDIRRELRQGTVLDCVLKYVKEHQIDLVVVDQIVIGTGSRAFKSLVNRLIDQLSIPVLVGSNQIGSESDHAKRAMSILWEKWEQYELAGDRQATSTEIQNVIAEELSVPPEHAHQLIEYLEATGELVWDGPLPDDEAETASEESEGESSEEPQACEGVWRFPRPAPPEKVEEVNDPGTSAAISLIQRAIEVSATDIHIDPASDQRYVVRFRVDGRIEDFCEMHTSVAAMTMKQIKLLANVSLSDPFHPTESRLDVGKMIPNYEVRITTAPVARGEAIAMRLINREKLYRPLNELGLTPDSFTAIYRMLHQKSGLVLITGPTGAGKTTSAYSILNVLFSEQQNIISIEDPVELLVPFMRQLNVDERHGFTMKAGLATILRMDPDVVFIGEVRDSEAAHIAMQAAACGKRAFSTMHMRDAASTISAMREFDIDARSIADNVSGVITQRLVRRLCESCLEQTPPTVHERALLEAHRAPVPATLARARGCDKCRGTGYAGRTGVFEAVVVEDAFADAVRAEQPEGDLRNLIRSGGASLADDALIKVRDGVTTLEEIQDLGWMADSIPMPEQSSDSEPVYERGTPYKPETVG